ncbi:MAG: KOW domain-containing RNA-binding protein [Synergistaceae bacterium]|nr:KOW domain-containing RNA-binding protein [Synergistaceae bacterium]
MAEFEIGQIVISRQGKDTGLIYVVSGFEQDGRVKLIRPARFNVSKPKKKNPKHLQVTSRRAEELINHIKAGKNIDAGFFYRSVGINGE